MHIVLFFTRGVSLEMWDRIGMFDREVALHKALQKRGVRVTFVTYGGPEDLQYQKRIPGIQILCNRWNLAPDKYERWLPWLHWPWCWRADLVKTNQMQGAEVAVWASQRWKKPLIARCGYMWSEFAVREHGVNSREAQESLRIESLVFQKAARVVITTLGMREDVVGRFPAIGSWTAIIPNYVDTARFAPMPIEREGLLFVGRLSSQKNVQALLESVRGLEVGMTIVGDGDLEESVRSHMTKYPNQVTWHRRVSHGDLATHYRNASVFVLPSLYEGHPKTLLEAMSCGCAVLAADSPGIREVIRHGETGWLCGVDAMSIRAALAHLMSDAGLRMRLGQNARAFAVANFALDKIVDMELGVYAATLAAEVNLNGMPGAN